MLGRAAGAVRLDLWDPGMGPAPSPLPRKPGRRIFVQEDQSQLLALSFAVGAVEDVTLVDSGAKVGGVASKARVDQRSAIVASFDL